MKAKLHFLVIGTLGLVMGCTGLSSDRYLQNKQSFMINQGNPPSYVEGYIDGCSAGRRLGGDKRFVYRKDSVRFDKDALYSRGWQEGQINCRNEVLAEDQHMLSTNKKEAPKTQNIDDERQKRVEAESRAAEAEMREIWEELKK
jgi:hypothetical protein